MRLTSSAADTLTLHESEDARNGRRTKRLCRFRVTPITQRCPSTPLFDESQIPETGLEPTTQRYLRVTMHVGVGGREFHGFTAAVDTKYDTLGMLCRLTDLVGKHYPIIGVDLLPHIPRCEAIIGVVYFVVKQV